MALVACCSTPQANRNNFFLFFSATLEVNPTNQSWGYIQPMATRPIRAVITFNQWLPNQSELQLHSTNGPIRAEITFHQWLQNCTVRCVKSTQAVVSLQNVVINCVELLFGVLKGKKGRYSSSWEPHLRATGRDLPYGITQCYLPPDTSERAPPNPSHAGWYSIYLPWRDGRLSWPSWLDSAPVRSRTSDLSITSPTQNRCTTKTTITVTCMYSQYCQYVLR